MFFYRFFMTCNSLWFRYCFLSYWQAMPDGKSCHVKKRSKSSISHLRAMKKMFCHFFICINLTEKLFLLFSIRFSTKHALSYIYSELKCFEICIPFYLCEWRTLMVINISPFYKHAPEFVGATRTMGKLIFLLCDWSREKCLLMSHFVMKKTSFTDCLRFTKCFIIPFLSCLLILQEMLSSYVTCYRTVNIYDNFDVKEFWTFSAAYPGEIWGILSKEFIWKRKTLYCWV